MERLAQEHYQPSSLLVHSLINKLSVIIGRCELMVEKVGAEGECAQRLLAIRDIAKSMAEELVQHQGLLAGDPTAEVERVMGPVEAREEVVTVLGE